MTTTTPHPDPRIERLIELLETLIQRETETPATERLDQILEQLTRIDRSLHTAAEILRNAAQAREARVTAEVLTASLEQTSDGMQAVLDEQRRMRAELADLARQLGLPPGGRAQIG